MATLSTQQLQTMSAGMGGTSSLPTNAPTTPTGGKLTTRQLQQMSTGMQSSSPSLTSKATPNNSWASYDKQYAKPTTPSTFLGLGQGENSLPSKYMSALGTDYANAIPNFLSAAGSGQAKPTDLGTQGKPIGETTANIRNVAEGALRSTSSALGTLFAPISEAINTAVNSPAGMAVANSPALKNVLDTVNNLEQKYSSWAQQNPEQAKNLEAGLNVGTALIGGKTEPTINAGLKSTGTELGNMASDAGQLAGMAKDKIAGMLPESKPTVAQPLNDVSVIDNYNRSIKPTISGKKNAGAIANANTQVTSGLKAIYDNKNNLKFTDETGAEVAGQTPKTVSQLSDAIAQTKQSIYDQYNKLATEAGGKGLAINTRNIGMELDPVINSKSLAISNPSAIQYAKDLQTRLWKNGELDSKTAQEVIQNYNTELKNFYRNPTPGMASNVQVDAMVANMLRKQLDDGITQATGEAYQPLKNQYGALASMEADVARKAQQIAKQNNVPFVSNLSNIASGAELIRGLMTGNVVDTAVGAGIKGIQLYNKYLNNPDRGVSNIFNEFDRAGQTSSAANTTMPNMTANTTANVGDNAQSMKNNSNQSITQDNTFQPKSQTVKGISNFAKNPKLGLSVNDITAKVPKDLKQEVGDIHTNFLKMTNDPKLMDKLIKNPDAYQNIDTLMTKLENAPTTITKDDVLNARESVGIIRGIDSDIEGSTPKSSTLIQEAKKYKSAEEFVNSKDILYHGTSDKSASSILKNGINTSKKKSIFNGNSYGFSLSPNPNIAQDFAREAVRSGGSTNIIAFKLKPNAKILSFDALPKSIKDLSIKAMDIEKFDKAITEYATKNGYDAIKLKNEVNIVNPKSVSMLGKVGGGEKIESNSDFMKANNIKSQLTDIWNKANKK